MTLVNAETGEVVRPLRNDAARRIVKRLMRDLSEDEADGDQLALPGLGLPSVIAVPADDGVADAVREMRAGDA